jgi:hypothetical protein
MSFAPLHRLLMIAAVAAPLALGVAGCESMDNPFAEKQKPLPGDRKALFPEGVPGVQFGAPPPQPTNSNIPISPQAVEEQQGEQNQQRASRQQPAQQSAPQPARSAKSSTKSGDDPWSGTR